jgi:abortive infection bacteriophage resistance protein
MEYLKPALDYERQADLLMRRGLQANRKVLVERLKSVNYYRLTGYLHTFRKRDAQWNPLDEYQPAAPAT